MLTEPRLPDGHQLYNFPPPPPGYMVLHAANQHTSSYKPSDGEPIDMRHLRLLPTHLLGQMAPHQLRPHCEDSDHFWSKPHNPHDCTLHLHSVIRQFMQSLIRRKGRSGANPLPGGTWASRCSRPFTHATSQMPSRIMQDHIRALVVRTCALQM